MRPEGRPSGRSDPLSFQIWVFTISSAVRRHGRDRILVLSMSVPFLHSEQHDENEESSEAGKDVSETGG